MQRRSELLEKLARYEEPRTMVLGELRAMGWDWAGEPLLVCECAPWAACPWEPSTAEVPGCWTHPGIHPHVSELSAKAALIKADHVERSSALLIPVPG